MSYLYRVLKNSQIAYHNDPYFVQENEIVYLHKIDNMQKELQDKIQSYENEAEQKINVVVKSAKLQTDEIIENLKNDCKKIYNQKAIEGYEYGVELSKKQYNDAFESLRAIEGDIKAEFEKKLKEYEEKTLDLAFILARKIVDVELDRNDSSILSAVNEALIKFKDENNLSVELSKENADKLNSADFNNSFDIRANNELGNTDILLTSDFGTVDASVDVQFNNLKKSLLKDIRCNE